MDVPWKALVDLVLEKSVKWIYFASHMINKLSVISFKCRERILIHQPCNTTVKSQLFHVFIFGPLFLASWPCKQRLWIGSFHYIRLNSIWKKVPICRCCQCRYNIGMSLKTSTRNGKLKICRLWLFFIYWPYFLSHYLKWSALCVHWLWQFCLWMISQVKSIGLIRFNF